MDPIAVDVRLIKAVLGAELKIAPGRVLMARVVTTGPGGRGSLTIAGLTLEAKLPKEVQPGQELRLTVRHATPDRVELSMSDPGAVAASAASLPGGGSVTVSERDAGGAGGGGMAGRSAERHTLALTYDAPALGPVDLRFELDPQSLRLTATLGAGEPVDRALERAAELRDALSAVIGDRAVSVDVRARREPLDVYA
jgi:hypothetical protein